MENNNLFKAAVIGVIGFIVVPVVVNTGVTIIINAANGAHNLIEDIKYKHKIKKGLKNGSIVEIDGGYYEMVISDAKEA